MSMFGVLKTIQRNMGIEEGQQAAGGAESYIVEELRDEEGNPIQVDRVSKNPDFRNTFNKTSTTADRRLEEAKAMVNAYDWKQTSQTPQDRFIIIPSSCYLVDACCTKFRSFLKDKGLFYRQEKMTDAEIKQQVPKLKRKGGSYFMCVANSVALCKTVLLHERAKFQLLTLSNQPGGQAPAILGSGAGMGINVSGGNGSRKRKRGQPVIKEKVKRAPSAFIVFFNEQREATKNANPSASFGELGRILGVVWKGMDDKAKAVCTALLCTASFSVADCISFSPCCVYLLLSFVEIPQDC